MKFKKASITQAPAANKELCEFCNRDTGEVVLVIYGPAYNRGEKASVINAHNSCLSKAATKALSV